jgi:hypothetical protein
MGDLRPYKSSPPAVAAQMAGHSLTLHRTANIAIFSLRVDMQDAND